MLDVNEYRDRLERRLLDDGFTKLEKPLDTEEIFYIAVRPDDDLDFDVNFWEPMVLEVIRAMIDEGVKEFYRIDVYFDVSRFNVDLFNVMVSQGDNPCPRFVSE